jgi:hypothetical protein
MIRFKETVTLFETLLLSFDSDKKLTFDAEMNRVPNDALLLPSMKVLELIERNWSDQVYIPVLCSKFWKLTLKVGVFF